MGVRLKVDENLPMEIADLLRAYGHDAVTVLDQGWSGIADDDLWRQIQAEGRWLVTADKEFGDVRLYPAGSHAGVVLMRSKSEGLDEYLGLMRGSVRRLDFDELGGALVVVSAGGVRIRRAPRS